MLLISGVFRFSSPFFLFVLASEQEQEQGYPSFVPPNDEVKEHIERAQKTLKEKSNSHIYDGKWSGEIVRDICSHQGKYICNVSRDRVFVVPSRK